MWKLLPSWRTQLLWSLPCAKSCGMNILGIYSTVPQFLQRSRNDSLTLFSHNNNLPLVQKVFLIIKSYIFHMIDMTNIWVPKSQKRCVFHKYSPDVFFVSTNTQNHAMPTHTYHKAICCTLTPPNLLQTVPQAAHPRRYRLKINGVTSIDLKCEKSFKQAM